MGNAPDDVTDQMISDAGEAKQPSDEELCNLAIAECKNWDVGFECADVEGHCPDRECSYVLMTVRVKVPW